MKRTETSPMLPEDSTATAPSNQLGSEEPMQSATQSTSYQLGGHQASLSPAVQKHIGNLLKVSYQEMLTEPVPDRFANLLEQLEQAEKNGK